MKIVISAFFIFLVILSHSAFAKAPNPLMGEFKPDRLAAKAGEIVSTTLEFETDLPFGKVRLTASASEGLELVAGETSLDIADFKPGDKRSVEYKVKVLSETEQKILARVDVLGGSSGVTYGQAFMAVVNPADAGSGVVKTEKDGSTILVTTVSPAKTAAPEAAPTTGCSLLTTASVLGR